MNELKIRSNKKNEMIDITIYIQEQVDKENIENGYVIIYVPHTTAGITINEGSDPSVQQDIIKQLEKIIPEEGAYSHIEGNSDAHIKASLLGSSVTVLIKKKKLVLGTWQHIFFYEGDGPRNRKIYLNIISCK
jgi:secondary thiamine-phosphate synthase enzyme